MQSPNMIEVSLILFKILCIIMMDLCTHITFLILIHVAAHQNHKSELIAFGVCVSLVSYLYVLVTKKSMRFQVSNTWSLTFAKKMWFSSGACCKLNFRKWKSGVTNDGAEGLVLMSKSDTDCICNTLNLQVSYGHNGDQEQPTLQMVSDLLSSVTLVLERVGEEKYMLLIKVLMFLTYMFTNFLEVNFLLTSSSMEKYFYGEVLCNVDSKCRYGMECNVPYYLELCSSSY